MEQEILRLVTEMMRKQGEARLELNRKLDSILEELQKQQTYGKEDIDPLDDEE